MKTTATILACMTLAGLATASTAADDNKTTELSAADTSAWGDNVGAWKVVESAEMDENNPKVFVLKPGSGVLVNGETGLLDWRNDVRQNE